MASTNIYLLDYNIFFFSALIFLAVAIGTNKKPFYYVSLGFVGVCVIWDLVSIIRDMNYFIVVDKFSYIFASLVGWGSFILALILLEKGSPKKEKVGSVIDNINYQPPVQIEENGYNANQQYNNAQYGYNENQQYNNQQYGYNENQQYNNAQYGYNENQQYNNQQYGYNENQQYNNAQYGYNANQQYNNQQYGYNANQQYNNQQYDYNGNVQNAYNPINNVAEQNNVAQNNAYNIAIPDDMDDNTVSEDESRNS